MANPKVRRANSEATGKASKRWTPLESKRPLSQSLLWKLQRAYFERRGIEAWSTGTVPHHITSSPLIAEAYARIVFGSLRDGYAVTPGDGASDFRRQPFYIIELGTGPGRFAYLFLKRFLALLHNSALKDIPIKYVMTDFTDRNIESWAAHPWLQPFIEEGVLDFARFDVERDQKLRLLISGEVLAVRNLRNPIVVIANYLFDSLPQDAFFVSRGQLFETLVSLTTPEEESDLNDPEILSRIEMSYDHNLVDGNYYDDTKWNRILQDYRKRLPDAPFLFPIAALQCIRNLKRLSRGRLLLLSGDRGYSGDEALLEGNGAPTIAVHGSFSMAVDYQIIGEYCQRLGAQVLHPAHRAENLNVSAFMFGNLPGGFTETRQAYAETIEKFGPDDFFTLKEGISQIYDGLKLDQILAFLRLSCWDFKRFLECLPSLKKQLVDSSDFQKRELHEAIVKIWDAYLPIGEENDLAFELGTLLLEINYHEEALALLQHSVDLYGNAPGTAYNMGVCYYDLGQMEQALESIKQALELDPDFDAAKALCADLVSVVPGKERKSRRVSTGSRGDRYSRSGGAVEPAAATNAGNSPDRNGSSGSRNSARQSTRQ
jgi:tetratricopeptide (TPR) repeat protein